MSEFIVQLKKTLKQDISDLAALEDLLGLEKETLKTRNSQEIERLAQQKSELVSQIEARAKQKAKLFAGSGLGIRPGQVGKTLKGLGDEELMALWQESREMLEHCKERNTVNGTIISRSLQRTGKIMSLLRGQNKAQNLYSPKGKEQAYSGNQCLGKA